MAPPELPADAPVLHLAHPGEVHVLELSRHEPDAAVPDRLDGGFGQRLDVHPPLVRQPRLQDGAGAVAARHGQFVRFDRCEQVEVGEVGHDGLPRPHAVHAAIRFGRVVVDAGVIVENVDAVQIVALADGVVVEIVSRGDLDAAGAELGVHVAVADDGDFASDKGQPRAGADQVAVARVVRVHGEPGVAEHRFRSRRRDHDVVRAFGRAPAVQQRVADVPEVAAFRHVFHFEVGHRRLEDRVPVHQAFLPVDQAVFVQPHEDFVHGGAETLVHGKAFARPVERRAHAPELLRNLSPGVIAPFPDAIDELFASDGVAAYPLGFELALDDHLGGDAGVVGSHLP